MKRPSLIWLVLVAAVLQSTTWAQRLSSVDEFVRAALKEQGLTPASRANRRTLIRRLTIDLTGLLPTPSEIEDFENDMAPGAWERLVERLIASPQFGERWAQHWLDVVRYADSDGFEYDDPRPNAWRYRDWVVRAFNTDKSFKRFVHEQIAGDELFPHDRQVLAATGLHTLGPLRLNAGMQDEAKNRQEVLTEMTDLVGSAFLGLTIGCARCHDHKFEDFTQSDYFQLQAFFAATKSVQVSLTTDAEQKAFAKRHKTWKAEVAKLNEQIEAKPDDRDRLVAEKTKLMDREPRPLPSIRAATDELSPVPPTFVLNRGEPSARLNQVKPDFPAMLASANLSGPQIVPVRVAGKSSSGRRAALAQWLASPKHPLTGQVFANRIWQHLIGVGIVSTPNDFGSMGHDPSHPKLLDWLAAELHEKGIKYVIRQIVLSHTYQQSSATNVAHAKVDPQNTWLWRANRKRMESEVMRDTMLQLGGKLNRHSGGPAVRLPLHPEIAKLQYKGTWNAEIDTSQHTRRTLYVFLKRNNRVPFLEIFDSPSTMVSCGHRTKSNHAGQALSMLNGEFVQLQAKAFFDRVSLEVSPSQLNDFVERCFMLSLGRKPSDLELSQSQSFLEQHTAALAKENGHTRPNAMDKAEALIDFTQVLLNLDEFIYVR